MKTWLFEDNQFWLAGSTVINRDQQNWVEHLEHTSSESVNRSCGPEGVKAAAQAGSHPWSCVRVSQLFEGVIGSSWGSARERLGEASGEGAASVTVEPHDWRGHGAWLRLGNMWQGQKWPREALVKVQTQLRWRPKNIGDAGLWADHQELQQVWSRAVLRLWGKLCVLWWQNQRSVTTQAL